MRQTWRVMGAVVALIAGSVQGQTGGRGAGFWLVGNPPGTTSGWITGLTKDGGLAVGGAGFIGPTPGYLWTPSKGRSDFGLLAGMPGVSFAYGVSDTAVVVGIMADGNTDFHAYRWPGTGPLEDLGLLPGYPVSYARAISGDGGVIVGYGEWFKPSQQKRDSEAFRWTAAGGMQGLGHLTFGSPNSEAYAVSRDGTTVVGQNVNEFLWFQAFVWTEAGGMKALPTLTGTSAYSEARAVNTDGSVIVGTSTASNGLSRMVRWNQGAIEDIAKPFLGSSLGLAVSDDGEVVGGNFGNKAIVWTPDTQAVTLKDYLALHGVTVSAGYNPEYLHAISGDGRTFAGEGRHTSTGIREGFIATISSASACIPDCDNSGQLNIDDFICFQTFFALGEPKADCDASGALNIDDFICFQTNFAIGC